VPKQKSPKIMWIGVVLAVIGLGYTGWIFWQNFTPQITLPILSVSPRATKTIQTVESWLNPLLSLIQNSIGVLAGIGGLVLLIMNIEKVSHDLQDERRKDSRPVSVDRRKRK